MPSPPQELTMMSNSMASASKIYKTEDKKRFSRVKQQRDSRVQKPLTE